MATHPLIAADPETFLDLVIARWRETVLGEMRKQLDAMLLDSTDEQALNFFKAFFLSKISALPDEETQGTYFEFLDEEGQPRVADLTELARTVSIQNCVRSIARPEAPRKKHDSYDLSEDDSVNRAVESTHFEPWNDPFAREDFDRKMRKLFAKHPEEAPKKIALGFLWRKNADEYRAETKEYLLELFGKGCDEWMRIERAMAELQERSLDKTKRRYLPARARKWLRNNLEDESAA